MYALCETCVWPSLCDDRCSRSLFDVCAAATPAYAGALAAFQRHAEPLTDGQHTREFPAGTPDFLIWTRGRAAGLNLPGTSVSLGALYGIAADNNGDVLFTHLGQSGIAVCSPLASWYAFFPASTA